MWCYLPTESYAKPPSTIWSVTETNANSNAPAATQLALKWNSVLKASLQPATAAMYQRHWETFLQFLQKHQLHPVSFPVPEKHLALFLVHLHETQLSYSTIRTYTSAIAFVHKLAGSQDPTDTFIIHKTLQGIRNQQPPNVSQSLLPISKDLLHTLIDSLPFATNDTYSCTLWRAIFLLIFHGCLRAGEVVSSGHDRNIIHLNQLTVNSSSATIRFLTFKHSHGRTPTISIQAAPDSQHCPVQALRAYLLTRGLTPGFIFIHKDLSPATRSEFAKILKSALTMVGHPAHRYNTHSFRIGRATQLASENHSETNIRMAGRWHSAAYQHFIRPQDFVIPK